MAELDQLNVATTKYIDRNPALRDAFFQDDPLLRFEKENLKKTYLGGTLVQEGFMYQGAPSGFIAKGQELDITEKQVEQACAFTPREIYANITLSLEDIKIFNKGPAAAFDLVKSRVTNAYMTLSANSAIAQYLNGIRANYTLLPNGLAEVCNDGTNASWDGATYATYGTITRGGQVGPALNSVPVNVNGTIEYNTLVENYSKVSFGTNKPNLIVTTPLGEAYVEERFQPQQRFNDATTAQFGFTGLKFKSAIILSSRYAPGSEISGNQSATQTAAAQANAMLSASTGGVVTAYPTLTSETLWMLNARDPWLRLYVVDDPLFGGGFTGFKVAQGNFKVTGQIALAFNITAQPRYHKQLFGITG